MIKSSTVYLLAGLALLLNISFSQHLSPKHQSFSLPPGVTESDYVEGNIILKVKPEFAIHCSPDRIDIPVLKKFFDVINVSYLGRTFPHSTKPRKPKNELGQEMVDLTLIYELFYTSDHEMTDAVNLLLGTGVLEYAEPRYQYKLLYEPNDADSAGQYYLNQVHAWEAWDITKGDTNVVIGIIDTGTSFTHPDLVGKHKFNTAEIIDGLDNDSDGYIDNNRGWDFGGVIVAGSPPPQDNDPTYAGSGSAGHGVIVTGPAAAATDNTECIASIGFNTHFLPVKVTVDNGSIVVRGYEGIVYAADHGAGILNLSWGGPGWSQYGLDVVNYATINKGCLLVAAAGNTPDDIRFYPACYQNVIGVPGTQINSDIWFDTGSFGSTWNYLLDVAAPAQSIKTTQNHTGCTASFATGTSLASPIVCGAAALVKAAYPSYNYIQCGQRVRVTANDTIYDINPGYDEKLGAGELDVYNALTKTTPGIRILDINYTDGDDDILNIGDTVDVQARFINYLDSTHNLTITLSTPNVGEFEILNSSLYVGATGTMDTIGACFVPFRIVIKATAANDFFGYLKFSYTDSPSYSDWEYYPLEVNPTFENIFASKIHTSLDSKGHIGHTNFPNTAYGLGITYKDDIGTMTEGGFLIGTSPTKVSNNIRNTTSTAQIAGFQAVTPVSKATPGKYGDQEVYAVYNDDGMGVDALKVKVHQNAYEFKYAPDDDYLIMEYEIINEDTDTLRDAYAGMFIDWDLAWFSNNFSTYVPADRMTYIWEPFGTSYEYIGMGMVSADSMHAFAKSVSSFGFTTAEKFTAISSAPDSANSDTTDLVSFISGGPFNIAPSDTHRVAFVIMGGDSLAELSAAANAARKKYNCLIRGSMPTVELGPDIHDCDGPGTFPLNAGTGYSSYSWNTGATSPSISADSNGTYVVTVTNGSGCIDWDEIELYTGSGLSATYNVSATSVFVGDTVYFDDLTPGAAKWGWDFADGSDGEILPSVFHHWTTPGLYNVRLIVSNFDCNDTVFIPITVDTIVGTIDPFSTSQIRLFPNPSEGSATLSLSGNYKGRFSVEVTDILGHKSQYKTLSKINEGSVSTTINGATLPAGIYFVIVTSESGTRKVIKWVRS